MRSGPTHNCLPLKGGGCREKFRELRERENFRQKAYKKAIKRSAQVRFFFEKKPKFKKTATGTRRENNKL